MSCQKTLTIAEASSPARFVHWPMETVTAGKLVDCVLGVQVPFTPNVLAGGLVGYAFIPGLVGNALHFYQDAIYHAHQVSMGVPTTTIASLNHDADGFSLCAWMKINSYGDLAGVGYGTIRYVGNLSNGELYLYFKNGESKFVARDSIGHVETINVTMPTLGAWHFLHMFQDIAGGKMGIQFDNGAITYASFVPGCNASTGGLVQVIQSGAGWVPNDWICDEITLRLDKPFTAAQLAYLYNSGAGRTCPITLP